jgi:hypothetical protein
VANTKHASLKEQNLKYRSELTSTISAKEATMAKVEQADDEIRKLRE